MAKGKSAAQTTYVDGLAVGYHKQLEHTGYPSIHHAEHRSGSYEDDALAWSTGGPQLPTSGAESHHDWAFPLSL